MYIICYNEVINCDTPITIANPITCIRYIIPIGFVISKVLQLLHSDRIGSKMVLNSSYLTVLFARLQGMRCWPIENA